MARTVVHYRSNSQIGEITPLDLSFGVFLDRPGYINYSIPVGHTLANIQYTNPYVTDFMYVRDNLNIMGGLHTEAELDFEENTLKVSGLEWKHYFERRVWPFNPNDPGTALYSRVQIDSFTVITEILNTVLAQPKSLPFTYSLGTSGSLINIRIEPGDGEDIHSKIQQLSEQRPGFDWTISPTRVITAFAEKKGVNSNYVLEKNKNVKEIGLTNQGIRASHVLGLGAGSSQRIASLQNNPAVERRYDVVKDFGEVIDPNIVKNLTKQELDIQSTQSLALSIACVSTSSDEIWRNVSLGDSVNVVGDVQGYVYVDDDYRIVGIEGSVNENGDEALTISVDNG